MFCTPASHRRSPGTPAADTSLGGWHPSASSPSSSPSWLPPSCADAAQAPVGLGTAGSFAVLAGAGITNTGPTTVNGDVGTFPTTSETGTGR